MNDPLPLCKKRKHIPRIFLGVYKNTLFVSNFQLLQGKYVWVGGFPSGGCGEGYTEAYENGEWTALKPYPKKVIYHCVTFMPDDNSKFYVLGGLDYTKGKTIDPIMEYDFTKDKYTEINTINNGLAAHGCTGYVDQESRYLVIVGGHEDYVVTGKSRFRNLCKVCICKNKI